MQTWRTIPAFLALLAAACSLWPLQFSQPTPPPPTTQIAQTQAPGTPTNVAGTSTPLPTLEPTPGFREEPSQSTALREGFQAELQELTNATRYRIRASVSFSPDALTATIDGLARIVYTNSSAVPLETIALRLWPNDVQYLSEMSIGPVLVRGELVLPEHASGGTAALVSLPQPLAPGDSVDLTAPFRVDVTGQISPDRPKRFGITNGVLLAPTFYPLVPRRIDGEWELVVPPEGGDTTTSESAFFELELRFPAEYDLVASGLEVDRTEHGDGTVTARVITGPVRDVAFTLGTFELFTGTASGVTVNVWMLPEHEHVLNTVLQPTMDQFNLLTELIGPYPYTELDVIDAPGAFGGIEYPGLIYIGTVGTNWVTEPVVHEVAHQWFYGVIGNDQVTQPWLDEAAATYLTALYYEFVDSPGSGTAYLSDFRDAVREADRADTPIGGALSDYVFSGDYGLLVYGKGALFFDALRAEMGDEAFFQFLQRLYTQYAFDILSAAEFQANAEATCSCELDPLFDLWVYQGGQAIPR